MKALMLLVLLGSVGFGQTASNGKAPSTALRIDLRMSSERVRIGDDMMVTVFFRSPEKHVTIWNFLGWGAPAGLYLRVFDTSGHEVQNHFAPVGEPAPPDLSGKDALLSIAGNVFTGFDDRIAVESLFPRPGQYKIKCLYIPQLSRDYFQGHIIWGKEDGPVESASVSIAVYQ